MLKKHPDIVQKTLEMKQKIVSSETQTLLDPDSARTILPQDNHLDHVSDIIRDVVSCRETEPVRSVEPVKSEPFIMSPKSVESSIHIPPNLHPEEKSITMTTGAVTMPNGEVEAPRVPHDVPLIQMKYEADVGEVNDKEMDLSQIKQGRVNNLIIP